MSDTHIHLEKDGDTIEIHFAGEVSFMDFASLNVLEELVNKGVDILAYSNKFNNKNQKSEIMSNAGESKSENTQFEQIASRLDGCRSRIHTATGAIEKSVDILKGSDPDIKEKKEDLYDSPGDSIISGLLRLLNELETQVYELEHEQNRLTKVFF